MNHSTLPRESTRPAAARGSRPSSDEQPEGREQRTARAGDLGLRRRAAGRRPHAQASAAASTQQKCSAASDGPRRAVRATRRRASSTPASSSGEQRGGRRVDQAAAAADHESAKPRPSHTMLMAASRSVASDAAPATFTIAMAAPIATARRRRRLEPARDRYSGPRSGRRARAPTACRRRPSHRESGPHASQSSDGAPATIRARELLERDHRRARRRARSGR